MKRDVCVTRHVAKKKMVTDEDAARRRVVEEFVHRTDVFSTGTFKLNRLGEDIARGIPS